MTRRSIVIAVSFTICITLLFGFFLGYKQCQVDVSQTVKDCEYMKHTFLRKAGSTVLVGNKTINYDLRSLDGGRTWIAVKMSSDSVKVLGDAEIIYPGLLQHIINMDSLYSYVEKNGTINLNDAHALKLLQGVGFTVDTTNK